MKKIKIGISGSHSTGKSTFIKRLEESLEKRSISFKSVSSIAVNCPLPILHDHTVESTLWIASRNIADEIETENKYEVVIVDRPILDCWAYFYTVCKDRYSDDCPKLKTLKSMISNWLPTYDLIYQTVIDTNIPIEDSKGRDLDDDYRNRIGNEMVLTSKLFNVTPRSLSSNNTDEEIEVTLKKIYEKIM